MMAVENAPHIADGAARPAAAPAGTPVAVVCDGVDAGGADRALDAGRRSAPTWTGTAYGRRRSSWSATSSRSPIPTLRWSTSGERPDHGSADRGRRPGRPAARRLPRPARRPAAQAPRGRARAVPRRGREGRTPRGRGRLPAALVPDGAALAGRAGRRARRRPTRPATWSPRRWPSRSPASTCTAARWRRSSGDRCRRSTRCSPAPARCWCSRTSSTTPTSARSSAAAPRSASTPCCWRRAAPTRSTAGRSRSPWERCSRLPWTRLARLVRRAAGRSPRRGFTTVALTLADDAVAVEEAVAGAGPGGPGAGLGGPRPVAALGADRRPARGDPDAPRASTPSTSPPPPRWPATSPPAADRRTLRVVR